MSVLIVKGQMFLRMKGVLKKLPPVGTDSTCHFDMFKVVIISNTSFLWWENIIP